MNAERSEFRFIGDAELRDTLQRHCSIIRATFDKACYPWTILFAGRSIEAILLDVMNANWARALASPKAPRGNSDIDTWNLAELIAVSADLGLVPRGVDELPYSVLHWRHLIRGNLPAIDRANLPIDIESWKEEARIGMEVLLKIHRWLS